MPLLSCEGCIKDLFVTETEFIERFTGKELWTWGYNFAGELGNNSVIRRSSPVQTVSGGTTWMQADMAGINALSVGAHAAAIKTDGTLWTWGRGAFGLLGNDSTINRSSPVQTVSGGTNWKCVSVGGYTTGAIKTDGSLWLWGWPNNGKLGNNNNVACQSSPVQTVSGGTNWKILNVGYSVVSAIKTDGTLWLWGQGSIGQLGNNDITDRSSPVQTVSGGTDWKKVSIGSVGGGVGAIKTDGSLWMWGLNEQGQLGTDSRIYTSSPVQTISGGTNWKDISVGNFHTAAIKTDGSLWTWGINSAGQLGNNQTVNRSSPVQTVSGGTNWRKVSTNLWNTAAVKTDGTLWMWGLNTRGELGNNSIVSRSSPVQTISGGTNWKDVRVGIFTSTALKIED